LASWLWKFEGVASNRIAFHRARTVTSGAVGAARLNLERHARSGTSVKGMTQIDRSGWYLSIRGGPANAIGCLFNSMPIIQILLSNTIGRPLGPMQERSDQSGTRS
jgi:hypothetical protein